MNETEKKISETLLSNVERASFHENRMKAIEEYYLFLRAISLRMEIDAPQPPSTMMATGLATAQ